MTGRSGCGAFGPTSEQRTVKNQMNSKKQETVKSSYGRERPSAFTSFLPLGGCAWVGYNPPRHHLERKTKDEKER